MVIVDSLHKKSPLVLRIKIGIEKKLIYPEKSENHVMVIWVDICNNSQSRIISDAQPIKKEKSDDTTRLDKS